MSLTRPQAGSSIRPTMYALILAGGKGERLRPYTDTLPKPMVELHGRPLLSYQIDYLKSAGVTDVVFLVGYLAEVISDFFGDGSQHGFRAHYSREESPLGRGGALKRGLASVPDSDEPVIATNGDVITDADLGILLEDYRHRASANPDHCASILTVPMVSPYGIVDVGDSGLVHQFREKTQLPYSINGGFYVLSPSIKHLLPEVGDHETTTFPELAAHGRMSAVGTDRFWKSVDSLKDLQDVEQHLAGQLTASVGA